MATGQVNGGTGGLADDFSEACIVAVGAALALGAVAYATTVGQDPFDATVTALPGTLTAVAGVAVWHWDVVDSHGSRLLAWTLGAGAALGGLILFVVGVQGQSLADAFPLLDFMTGVGTLAGALIGANEVRSIQAVRERERARLSAEFAREEREQLRFLHNLLRHNVLNKMNVVQAYTRMVHEETATHDEELDTVLEQTESVVEAVENVHVLIKAATTETDLHRVDLAPVVEEEVATLRGSFEAADVRTDFPETLPAHADDLVRYVFENLVHNAIEHNTDQPTVEVAGRIDGDTVTVTVADDGPGVSPERQQDLFEPSGSGDEGLGLYLVSTLVERYGGSVRLADSDLGGAAFVVELPRAD